MLKIYQATEIVEVIEQRVGRTRPWVVMAETEKGIAPFIVKLFSTAEVDVQGSLQSEIFCNKLAVEFDLKVPQAALIEIPDHITMRLTIEQQQQYLGSDPRLKFGTYLLPNVNSALPELPKKYYQKRIQMDTLYAFDNFIRNGDRGQQKTNLLISKKNAYLIDHELALKSIDIQNINLNDHVIEPMYSQYHLFHNYLKRSIRKNKKHYFDEFQEYLKGLSSSNLISLAKQLNNEGFSVNTKLIFDWLSQVKGNSTKFVNSLKESIE